MRHSNSCLRSLTLSLGLLTPIAIAPAQIGWTQWTSGTGANNHWYLAVYVPGGINWNDARTAAQSLGGDLATITSAAENTFVFQRIANPIFWRVVANPTRIFGPWLGGFQPPGSAEPLGGWTWVTGETWGYSRWANGEPNNFQGLQEDQLHYFTLGTNPNSLWNDLRGTSLVPGFVVEATTPPIAAYLPLGTGCAPIGQQAPTLAPAIAGVDLPRLGTTSNLRFDGLPPTNQLAVIGVGTTNRYAPAGSGAVALPFALDNLGWTGCRLLVAPETTFAYAATGSFDHPVTIPLAPSLLGQAVFFQGLRLAPGNVALTNSIAAYVGP
ncbi:MAG: hypothetical protein MUC36_27160 [Planctomycetes bacterium]|jgi:hypothetical protein|nr:hypothetical protein [Planctomycetota bacterium]